MAEHGNYIKISRSILEWRWYSDINTCRLFIHMLLKANWKEGAFKDTTVPRGSFVSSIRSLAEGTNLTEDEVRTALKKLLKSGEITKQSTNRYTLFTVVNYGLYQDVSQSSPNQLPGEPQTIPELFPTIEEGKKEKKEEGKYIPPISPVERFADANALFECLWKTYPSKKGKGQVSDAAKKRLLEIGFDEMSRAIDRYKAELEKDKDWRKPQNGSTFFNSGYVDYLDKNYEPAPATPVSAKKDRFHNFTQRSYDYGVLEKQLLDVQKKQE